MALMTDTLQRDIEKIRKERIEKEAVIHALTAEVGALLKQENGLQAALDYYASAGGNGQSVILPDFASLTIAKAAELVLRDNKNRPMTTRELVAAFQEHGKTTSYNAMDITLKDASDTFEKTQEGGRNYFKLKEW